MLQGTQKHTQHTSTYINTYIYKTNKFLIYYTVYLYCILNLFYKLFEINVQIKTQNIHLILSTTIMVFNIHETIENILYKTANDYSLLI